MKKVSAIFMGITAILHILFFKLESIDFMKPETLKRFGLDEHSGEFVKTWAFNQGFYNLFLAIGLLYSIFLLFKGNVEKGVTLASFILLTIIGAGLVLYISVPAKFSAALIQAVPAVIALTALKLSHRKMERV